MQIGLQKPRSCFPICVGSRNFHNCMSPEDIFKRLNLILGKQIEIIERYNGFIDKLNGDEVYLNSKVEEIQEIFRK